MSAREVLLAAARRHMWAAWQLSSEELASQAAETLLGLGMLVPEGGAQELERLRARVAELEALAPAPIQTCRKCGAGYTYGEPCQTCVFRARMASELQARGLEGEHYAAVHHDYRISHDLPQAGGQR